MQPARGYPHFTPCDNDSDSCPSVYSALVSGLVGGLHVLSCLSCTTTLEVRSYSILQERDGALVRPINLPEIIEPRSGRTQTQLCLPLAHSAHGLRITRMAWHLMMSFCLASREKVGEV